ncbi:bola-like protein [Tilletiaria anomala UBC 951]|uniref:Bola-like protein n=1 Tax=Tilletiaria anomala (strain ATCC 24038 / CBS 436.72 / UBC 951) TaxID=1037660 RepID=A0A066V7W9_TILAU|nr:bola-like protein [Tilletiaria anomala UBC 951]KDN37586.1 bola-like protein [Tilletiaria anomala UBC 951]
MVTSKELEDAIRAKIQGVSAAVVSDVSGGCGQAYDVVIVSEAFEGLTTLKRHRLVNESLKDEIAQMHAFSQKTYTPKQYESQ